MPLLISALALLLAQAPQVQQPRRNVTNVPPKFIGIQGSLTPEQRLKVSSAIEQWRSKFAPTFSMLKQDPEQLAAETRKRLSRLSMKGANNHDIFRDTTMWVGPTVHNIVGFRAVDVTHATTDIENSAGLVAPPNLPANLTQRPRGISLPQTPSSPPTQPGGSSQGAALREFDLALPMTERSTFDNGSAFEGDRTLHLFNGGQIISPTWSTKISMGQVLPLDGAPMSVAVDVDLATDREYYAGAFTAYASIGTSMKISVQDLQGTELATSTVELGRAIAPFIGQANPHFVAPMSVRLPVAEPHGQQVKVVIQAESSSTLFGPGVVSEDVRITVTRVHVGWIPA